jgi:hypothetical protein
MLDRWNVKVIGIPAKVRKPGLAAILKILISDVVIPSHQTPGQNRFAWVNNFKSEQEANKFTAELNGVFIQLPSKVCIKCEIVTHKVHHKEGESADISLLYTLIPTATRCA